MAFFLSRSFGVLALLAALFAFFACWGPWLRSYPDWFVVVPAGMSLLLVILGITLLRLPANRISSLAGVLLAKAVVVLAIIGGLTLTYFFHGNTEADQNGINILWQKLVTLGRSLLIGVVIFVILVIALKFKNKNKEPKT